VEAVDERFRTMVNDNAAVERLYTGMRWGEGPVWFGDGRYLLWSDIPNNRILRWTEESGQVSVFRNPSNNSNGNTRDSQGLLITCERRQVTRTEPDGKITVLMDRFQGKRLNSPNDIVVHPDGHIWFTDPGYGIMTWYEGEVEPFELPTRTYRLNPATGQLLVEFDGRTVAYDPGEGEEITLAYAVTVHKAQGSEFSAVLLVLTTHHYMMLQRNLLYTALTRGRRLVVVLGSKRALGMAIRNDRPVRRFTHLAARLRETQAPATG
jgi:hypothetical protein